MKKSIRRLVQVAFFVLFLFLLVQTEYKGEDTLGQPVRVFLEIDPLLTIASIVAAGGFFLFAVGLAIALALAVGAARLIGLAGSALGLDEQARRLLARYLPLALLTALLVWAVFPFGFDRGLPLPMGWGIATVVVTLLLGRVFCGWLCPMGTLHQFVGWLSRDSGKVRIEKNQFMPSQRWKYSILIVLLAAAMLGFQLTGVMDPISLLIRSFSVVVSPVINQVGNGLYDMAYASNNDIIIGFADWLFYPNAGLLAFPNLLSFSEPHFAGALLVAAVFVVVLALNLRRSRWWCRNLCPLGALLGAISRNSFYRLEIDREKCINCGLCHAHCQGACDPEHRLGWRPSECFVCFHCTDVCPTGALRFRFASAAGKEPGIDVKRRRALGAAAAGLVAVPILRAGAQYKTEASQGGGHPVRYNPALIRPPGSLPEEEFLDRCVRCGECMKVCTTNGLHPATLEAGIEGLWTPVLVPRIGYCEYYCTLCGQVCPTGAIRRLDVESKIRTVIGIAFFDVSRCLPYAFGTTCVVCEEHCPTSPKAIWLQPVDRFARPAETTGSNPYGAEAGPWSSPTEQTAEPEQELQTGQISPYGDEQDLQSGQISPYGDEQGVQGGQLLQPRVDLDLCIGCGICEKVCVITDKPGIRVTSVGETRHPANSIKLEGSFSQFG